jgi:putative FmdB family regulatory protein
VPLFEYECAECQSRFEQLVFNSADSNVACRKCGSSQVRQLLSTFAVAASSDKPVNEAGPCGSCGAAERGMCQMM